MLAQNTYWLLFCCLWAKLAATLQSYLVFAKNANGTTSQQSIDGRIESQLQGLVGPTQVQNATSVALDKVMFWTVEVESDVIEQIRQISEVSSVIENVIVRDEVTASPKDVDSTAPFTEQALPLPHALSGSTIVQDPESTPDLGLLSWPPNFLLPDGDFPKPLPPYTFDAAGETSGQDTFVYVMDEGVYVENVDFTRMKYPPKPEDWIFTPGVKMTYTDDHPQGHGTCAASKTLGRHAGVSKFSHLIPVKHAGRMDQILSGIAAIMDDLRSKKRHANSVILIPAINVSKKYKELPEVLPDEWSMFYSFVVALTDPPVNAVVVLAAGNEGEGSERVDTFPPLMGEFTDRVVVVGATTPRGVRAATSQALPRGVGNMVWAVGEVVCAGTGSTLERRDEQGTSFAAASVAGLIAYFLGLPNGPFSRVKEPMYKAVTQFLAKTAARPYNIPEGGSERVIWNLIDGTLPRFSGSDNQTLPYGDGSRPLDTA